MIVKIGDSVYYPEKQPSSVYLTDADKRNLASMPAESHFFTVADDGIPEEEMDAFVAGFKEHIGNYREDPPIDVLPTRLSDT